MFGDRKLCSCLVSHLEVPPRVRIAIFGRIAKPLASARLDKNAIRTTRIVLTNVRMMLPTKEGDEMCGVYVVCLRFAVPVRPQVVNQ